MIFKGSKRTQQWRIEWIYSFVLVYNVSPEETIYDGCGSKELIFNFNRWSDVGCTDVCGNRQSHSTCVLIGSVVDFLW